MKLSDSGGISLCVVEMSINGRCNCKRVMLLNPKLVSSSSWSSRQWSLSPSSSKFSINYWILLLRWWSPQTLARWFLFTIFTCTLRSTRLDSKRGLLWMVGICVSIPARAPRNNSSVWCTCFARTDQQRKTGTFRVLGDFSFFSLLLLLALFSPLRHTLFFDARFWDATTTRVWVRNAILSNFSTL